MKERIIKRFGDHWERAKMFTVKGNRVTWTELAWPENDPPLKGARGVYVLYRGDKAIYVGTALKGADPIASRIHDHAKDALAPWWDSVCWYDFGEHRATAELVESFLIAHGVGLWNGAEAGGTHFGREAFLQGRNHAQNDLWRGGMKPYTDTEG